MWCVAGDTWSSVHRLPSTVQALVGHFLRVHDWPHGRFQDWSRDQAHSRRLQERILQSILPDMIRHTADGCKKESCRVFYQTWSGTQQTPARRNPAEYSTRHDQAHSRRLQEGILQSILPDMIRHTADACKKESCRVFYQTWSGTQQTPARRNPAEYSTRHDQAHSRRLQEGILQSIPPDMIRHTADACKKESCRVFHQTWSGTQQTPARKNPAEYSTRHDQAHSRHLQEGILQSILPDMIRHTADSCKKESCRVFHQTWSGTQQTPARKNPAEYSTRHDQAHSRLLQERILQSILPDMIRHTADTCKKESCRVFYQTWSCTPGCLFYWSLMQHGLHCLPPQLPWLLVLCNLIPQFLDLPLLLWLPHYSQLQRLLWQQTEWMLHSRSLPAGLSHSVEVNLFSTRLNWQLPPHSPPHPTPEYCSSSVADFYS